MYQKCSNQIFLKTIANYVNKYSLAEIDFIIVTSSLKTNILIEKYY